MNELFKVKIPYNKIEERINKAYEHRGASGLEKISDLIDNINLVSDDDLHIIPIDDKYSIEVTIGKMFFTLDKLIELYGGVKCDTDLLGVSNISQIDIDLFNNLSQALLMNLIFESCCNVFYKPPINYQIAISRACATYVPNTYAHIKNHDVAVVLNYTPIDYSLSFIFGMRDVLTLHLSAKGDYFTHTTVTVLKDNAKTMRDLQWESYTNLPANEIWNSIDWPLPGEPEPVHPFVLKISLSEYNVFARHVLKQFNKQDTTPRSVLNSFVGKWINFVHCKDSQIILGFKNLIPDIDAILESLSDQPPCKISSIKEFLNEDVYCCDMVIAKYILRQYIDRLHKVDDDTPLYDYLHALLNEYGRLYGTSYDYEGCDVYFMPTSLGRLIAYFDSEFILMVSNSGYMQCFTNENYIRRILDDDVDDQNDTIY